MIFFKSDLFSISTLQFLQKSAYQPRGRAHLLLRSSALSSDSFLPAARTRTAKRPLSLSSLLPGGHLHSLL